MKLLIGLGNPGKEYEGTRHNIGFAFADFVAGQEAGPLVEKTDDFMNNSGGPVRKLVKRHDVHPKHLVVAHDDLDIEFGRFKLSFGRNAAGHHGVESIIEHLKTKEFWRLRIGIANPKLVSMRAAGTVADFVLSKFNPEERGQLSEIFERALAALVHAK